MNIKNKKAALLPIISMLVFSVLMFFISVKYLSEASKTISYSEDGNTLLAIIRNVFITQLIFSIAILATSIFGIYFSMSFIAKGTKHYKMVMISNALVALMQVIVAFILIEKYDIDTTKIDSGTILAIIMLIASLILFIIASFSINDDGAITCGIIACFLSIGAFVIPLSYSSIVNISSLNIFYMITLINTTVYLFYSK